MSLEDRRRAIKQADATIRAGSVWLRPDWLPEDEIRAPVVTLGPAARQRIVSALIKARTDEFRRLGFDPRMEAARLADIIVKAVNE